MLPEDGLGTCDAGGRGRVSISLNKKGEISRQPTTLQGKKEKKESPSAAELLRKREGNRPLLPARGGGEGTRVLRLKKTYSIRCQTKFSIAGKRKTSRTTRRGKEEGEDGSHSFRVLPGRGQ